MEIVFLAVAGLLLSIYALYVEKKAQSKKYKPLCDINKNISCTKAFASIQAKMFGFHNAYLGIMFYTTILLLSLSQLFNHVFYISLVALAFSVYLAYLSYIKMKNFCLVCSAIYIINLLLVVTSYQNR